MVKDISFVNHAKSTLDTPAAHIQPFFGILLIYLVELTRGLSTTSLEEELRVKESRDTEEKHIVGINTLSLYPYVYIIYIYIFPCWP